MNKFKVGDKIIRTGSNCGGMVRGETYEVGDISYGVVCLRGHRGTYSASYFDLAPHQYPNPPQVHAELIKAWADGAAVQFKSIHDGEWYDDHAPVWYRDMDYRIKPAKSDDELKLEKMEADALALAEDIKSMKGVSNEQV